MTVEKSLKKRSASNGVSKGGIQVLNRLNDIIENVEFSRSQLVKQLSDPRRNIDDECGYPSTENLDIKNYKDMYDREAVAARVVEVLPVESWKVQPEVFETPNNERETEFEEAWDSLGSQLRGTEWYQSEKGSVVWEFLLRIDRLSGIGAYGILLIGIDDGLDLEKEAVFGRKDRKVLFFRVFDQSLVTISRFEKDVNNPRFGQPVEYDVSFSTTEGQLTGEVSLVIKKVHWTRVIHVADSKGSSEIFAVPRQRAVWNRLSDLRKLYGGSAEMYWRGAFIGLSFETHPQLGGDVPDLKDPVFVAALRGQIEKYENGLQRYLSTTGMTVKSLAPQVVDPTPQIDTQIKAICIKLGVPKRIFEGSERGELASSQDSRAWHSRLKARQNNYLTPNLIVPLVDRLINLGILSQPKEYFVRWPDLDTLTELEQAPVAVQKTEALAKYVQGSVESIVAPFDFLTQVLGFEEEEAEAMIKATMKAVTSGDTMTGFDDETEIPSNGEEDRGGNG